MDVRRVLGVIALLISLASFVGLGGGLPVLPVAVVLLSIVAIL